MNVNVLEKVARMALKGENIAEKSNEMLRGGVLTPAEHRSLKSLSAQIAANLHVNNGGDSTTMAWVKPQPMGWA